MIVNIDRELETDIIRETGKSWLELEWLDNNCKHLLNSVKRVLEANLRERRGHR
jgi:hypothetical protein